MAKSISKIRSQAFANQGGLCTYCGRPMCQGDAAQFARDHQITTRQAVALRCTAEHLVPRCEGGRNSPSNIAAACAFCNHQRHRAARPLSPDAYRKRVQRRLANGTWHAIHPR